MLESIWTQSKFCELKKSVIIDYNMPNNLGHNNLILFFYYRSDLDEYKAYTHLPHQNKSFEVNTQQINQYLKQNSNPLSQLSLEEILNLINIHEEKKLLEHLIYNQNEKKIGKI